MISLYEHNQAAYQAAIEMLEETGKAAVIHPTGTGKSFLGFKLSEDNPEKRLLWISPSEYIFQTQMENLKEASGYVPENITFCTYARLMNLDEAELAGGKPDFLVLDEFHRGGATIWGEALRKLLKHYADVPLLGLSATAIRYLDNQRNMADELFDGCVASEMTLGEAIARGILNPPRYVMAVYSYQKDLERYQKKVRRIRGKACRDRAERILEALRRALENAEGLEVIFQKYMTDPHGKYIVFCSNKEHMDEMMSHLEWFRLVDEAPRIYSVYSETPGAREAFAAFKRDNQGDHLRLLYCIDALNEGIHVEPVSGVILLRPTVSPVIYKQQIGRALSASRSREPVIFDIVNNIAGLYSIRSLQEEIQEFTRDYRFLGGSGGIAPERFQLIEAVEDCRRLFEELEETLSASWEFMYAEAKAYYEENGDLLPPRNYVTENGAKLGNWIVTQRMNYRNGTGLSQARIDTLNRIGMSWQTLHERQWEEKFRLAEAYHADHGDLSSAEGMAPSLRYWIVRQRQKQRDGLLPEEQFAKLSALGMVWEFEDAWEHKFALAKAYYEEHGNLDIPATYRTEDGTCLGAWYRGVREQYNNGTLTEERRHRIESIGIQGESVRSRSWRQYYDLAQKYFEEYGNLNVPASYITRDGRKLGAWISGQRHARRTRQSITEEQIRLLDEIGMSWQRFSDKWETGYAHARAYAEAFGTFHPPAGYQAEDGFALGSWAASQRGKYAAGKLKPGQVKQLEALGIVWEVQEGFWECGYEHAKAYYEAHGNLSPGGRYRSEDGYRLGEWLANQRSRNKGGRMTPEQRRRLNLIGMCWSVQEERWQAGYEHLLFYRSRFGNAEVPQKYVCGDSYLLGEWVSSQRAARRKGKLSEERARKLEAAGIC